MKKVTIICFLFVCTQLFSQEQYYNDVSYLEIKQSFLKQDYSRLKKLVKKELSQSVPNGLAMHYANKIIEDIDISFENELTEEQKKTSKFSRIIKKQSNAREIYEMYKKCLFVEKLPLYTIDNIIRRVDIISIEDVEKLLKITLKTHGDHYRIAWTIDNISSVGLRMKLWEKILSDNFYDTYPAFKNYINHLYLNIPDLGLNDWSSYTKITGIQEYILKHPNDAIAYRKLGAELKSIHRYVEAKKAYKKSYDLDPLYYDGNSYKDAVIISYILDDYTTAEKELKGFVKVHYPNANQNLKYLELSAKLLSTAGDKMEARRRIKKVLDINSRNEEMIALLAGIESDSERYEEALKLYISLSHEKLKEDLNVYNSYLICLKETDSFELLLDEIVSFTDNERVGSENIYYRFFDYYNSIEEKEIALKFLSKGVEIHPLSSWLLGRKGLVYNELKRYTEAESAFRMSLRIDPNSGWVVEGLKLSLLANNKNVESEIDEIFKKQNYSYVLMNKLKEFKEKSNQLEYLKSTRSLNKKVKDRNIYVHLKGKESIKYLENEFITSNSKIDSLFYIYLLTDEYYRDVQNNKLSKLEINNYFTFTDLFLSLGGNLRQYHNIKAYLHRSSNDEKNAKLEIQKAIEVAPLDNNLVKNSIIAFNNKSGYINWRKQIRKNKYDYDVISYYVKMNTTYPGSDINSIWAYEECKSIFPEKSCQYVNYARALKSLGDPFSLMNSYKKNNKIATGTKRYIEWYDDIRRKCWVEPKEVKYIKNENKVIITDKDGEESIFQDDPLTGKRLLHQKGKVWVRYEYTEKGSIKRISTSANMNLKLTYDNSDNITRLESSEKGILDFKYNENNKPIRIVLDDKDTLFVSYDKFSEIESVKSNSSSKMSFKITQIFKDLISLSTSFDIGDINLIDEEYTNLNNNYIASRDDVFNNERLSEKVVDSYDQYVRYLMNNLKNDAEYTTKALEICIEMINYLDDDINISIKEKMLNFSIYFHELLLKIRRRGVANDYWNNWIGLQELLEREKIKQSKQNNYRRKIEKIQSEFRTKPVQLLSTAQWLPKSDLSNNAYWSMTELREIFPKYDFSLTTINQVYKRKNGDILIALNNSIALKKNGFWRVLYYDTLNRKLAQNPELIKISSKISFSFFTETANNQLYVNTSMGTFLLNNDYTKLKKIIIDNSEYIGNRSLKMIGVKSSLILYNETNINILKLNDEDIELEKSLKLPNEKIHKVLSINNNDDALDNFTDLFIQTNKGIYLLTLDYLTGEHKIKNIFKSNNIVDFEYSFSEKDIYYLENNTLYKIRIPNSWTEELEKPTEVYGNIVKNVEILGLCTVPINKEESAIGVLTDIGINIFRDKHFEFFKINKKDGLDEYTSKFYYNKSDFGILTKGKFIEFSLTDYFYDTATPKKIKNIKNKGITLILEKGDLYYSYNKELFSNKILTNGYGTNISDFDVDENGDIYFCDYRTVYKVSFKNKFDEKSTNTRNLYELKEIFTINPYVEEDFFKKNQGIKQVKIGQDGTIWVITELSVLRFNEGMSPVLKEFNYFKNKSEYPAKTLEIYNIIETYDNQIWVVNSSESWNNYKGINLTGGLVKYNKSEDKFDFFNKEDPTPDFPWFITSYSKISKDEALVGTTSGFAYHSMGGLRTIRDIGNQSYVDIENVHKNLFLGTKGVRFGEFWLFGSAEGVIAYKDNQWFYPDRLNQLLPKFSEYGLWGGNKVNTIEIDHLGRLNIATDLGLLIIDADKFNPFELLMMSQDLEKVIEYHNIEKLKNERKIMVSNLPSSSLVGKLVLKAEKLQEKIIDLKKLKNSFVKDFELKNTSYETINIDSIDVEISRVTNRYSSLLLTLKEKNPVIYQALKIPPLEIASLRNKLKDDECIVQYIPLENRLIIQLVTKQKLILKEVEIGKEELFNQAYMASDLLSNRDLSRGSGVDSSEKLDNEVNANMVLEQLYNSLISPIQNELIPYKSKVQIIAEGALNYIPFEALIYKDGNEKLHYAIEDLNFTYLSSLYMLQLLNQFSNTRNLSSLLMGDPDNSLEHARKEVVAIAKELKNNPELVIGKEATVNKFKSSSKNKGIIHLATHGLVDRKSIKDSWLLFSDSKLKLSEIYEFNLENTNLMILSACETSLGKEGLETTTLARAFANAGVQYLVASLWRVNDESTKILMTKFYSEVSEGVNYMKALHNAKSYLRLYNNGQFKNPKYWAPFIILGKS